MTRLAAPRSRTLLAALVASLTLAGCGGGGEDPSPDAAPTKAAPTPSASSSAPTSLTSSSSCLNAGEPFEADELLASDTLVAMRSESEDGKDVVTSQLVAGATPGACRTWELESEGEVQVLAAAPGPDKGAVVALDRVAEETGEVLEPGEIRDRVRVYDPAAGAVVHTVDASFGRSPVVAPGRLGRFLVVSDEEADAPAHVVVDLSDGTVVRTAPGAPLVVAGEAVVVDAGGRWVAHDLASGAVLWEKPVPADGGEVLPSANSSYFLSGSSVVSGRTGLVVTPPEGYEQVFVDAAEPLATFTTGSSSYNDGAGQAMRVVDLETGGTFTDIPLDKGEELALEVSGAYAGRVWVETTDPISDATTTAAVDASGKTVDRNPPLPPIAAGPTWWTDGSGKVEVHDLGTYGQ